MRKASQAKRDAARLAVVADVSGHPHGPRVGLTRSHIESLRSSGVTRDEVVSMVRNMGGDHLADLIANDLDSYGEWAE